MKPKVWVMLVLLIGLAELNCYAQSMKNLVPDYFGIQYAGSIGWVSVGTGYDLFGSRMRTGLQYGYVPKDLGGELHILSASVYYQPLKIKVARVVAIHPLNIGIKAAYHFGDQFYLNWPERFPRGYYWWKSAL